MREDLRWGSQRSILQACWPVSIAERTSFSKTPYHKNKEGGEWPRKTHAINLWPPCTCACTHRHTIKHKHSRIMHRAWGFRSVRNRIYNTKRTYFRPDILRVQDQPQSRILSPIFLKAFLRKMHKILPLTGAPVSLQSGLRTLWHWTHKRVSLQCASLPSTCVSKDAGPLRNTSLFISASLCWT